MATANCVNCGLSHARMVDVSIPIPTTFEKADWHYLAQCTACGAVYSGKKRFKKLEEVRRYIPPKNDWIDPIHW